MKSSLRKILSKILKMLLPRATSKAVESFIAQKGGKKEMMTGIAKDDTRLSQELFGFNKMNMDFISKVKQALLPY